MFPARHDLPEPPKRIVLIRPCCIGDVVLATGALHALRQAYPNSEITWAVSQWSSAVIEAHPDKDFLLDTGASSLPTHSLRELWMFVSHLRQGNFELAVSLVRSPLMSLAVVLSGIPHRAGIDSAGRGFGYNLRLSIDPDQPRHEYAIYLDVVKQLGINTENIYPNMPVSDDMLRRIKAVLAERGIGAYFIVNPAGGSNPGMVMDSKRYPPQMMAQLTNRLAKQLNLTPVIVAGPNDRGIVDAMTAQLDVPFQSFVGEVSFAEIAALDQLSRFYIGNDTGLTHLAAATGATTIMILGPSDPARYAPVSPRSLALWKQTIVNQRGVSSDNANSWNWQNDGISVDDAFRQIIDFLESLSSS